MAESTTFGERVDASVYDQLHVRVATQLIALAELDFAGYVLRGVPVYAQDSEHRRLQVLLRGRAVADENGSVVPAPRSGGSWWEESPQALPPRDSDGRERVTWAAGRVESVDDEGIHLHIAQVGSPDETPAHSAVTVRPEVWQQRCLDSDDIASLTPGRFVELGRYRGEEGDAVTVIRLLPRTVVPEPRYAPSRASRWMRK